MFDLDRRAVGQVDEASVLEVNRLDCRQGHLALAAEEGFGPEDSLGVLQEPPVEAAPIPAVDLQVELVVGRSLLERLDLEPIDLIQPKGHGLGVGLPLEQEAALGLLDPFEPSVGMVTVFQVEHVLVLFRREGTDPRRALLVDREADLGQDLGAELDPPAAVGVHDHVVDRAVDQLAVVLVAAH